VTRARIKLIKSILTLDGAKSRQNHHQLIQISRQLTSDSSWNETCEIYLTWWDGAKLRQNLSVDTNESAITNSRLSEREEVAFPAFTSSARTNTTPDNNSKIDSGRPVLPIIRRTGRQKQKLVL
jgi:hypothetical protein